MINSCHQSNCCFPLDSLSIHELQYFVIKIYIVYFYLQSIRISEKFIYLLQMQKLTRFKVFSVAGIFVMNRAISLVFKENYPQSENNSICSSIKMVKGCFLSPANTVFRLNNNIFAQNFIIT